MSNYHPGPGAVLTFNPDSEYLDSFVAQVIGVPPDDVLWFQPGSAGAWNDTAQGYIMPWSPVIAWLEMHESVPATTPPSGTYKIVVAGPPTYTASTGSWSQA